MTHIAPALSAATNDLFLDADGNLAMVTSAEAVGQHVRQRLGFFRGEWFLDTTAGMPWLDEILGQKYDPALSEAVVKAEILATHGVTEIASFSVSFIKSTRGLAIRDVDVMTIYGEGASV